MPIGWRGTIIKADTTTRQNPAQATTQTALRFCMITTFYPPYNFGGDGIFVQRLVHALAAQGHHVTVIHCVDAYHMAADHEPHLVREDNPNIEVHALQSGVGILSPLITHQFAIPGLKGASIRRILQQGNFDVVHYHNVSLVGGASVLGFDTGSSDAVKLYTAHEYWLVCPLSTLWKHGESPCKEKSCTGCTLRAGKPPQWWRYTGLLKRQLSHLDALLAPSQFAIDKHREMGLDNAFIHLPNFLPLANNEEHVEPSVAIESLTRPYFLLVGRLEKSKGFQDAIALFKRFTEADLAIVGTGPYEQELQAMAEGCDNIHFFGKRQYRELTAWYRGAVAVIVPSIWYEPFGLIVIEAYAQKTPVIVNRAGALPELVQASGGGMVYDDQAGLREAAQALLSSPDSRCELGERGHQAYLETWTEEQHLAQYFHIIDEARARRQRD